MSEANNLNRIDKIYWHLVSARQYKEAFWILVGYFSASQNSWLKEVDMPAYYSAGLAAEHFLKCYLDLHEIEYPNKSMKGHNLSHLLLLGGEGMNSFFGLTKQDLEDIEMLNKRYHNDTHYGQSDLRYISRPGKRVSPNPDFFHKLLTKFENKLNVTLIAKFGKTPDPQD